MRSISLCLKALFPLFLFLGSSLFARDYYVNGKTGKDIPTGGTIHSPWKTIAYALTQVPSPTNPKLDHVIHIVGGQTYVQTQALQMKYNVRLVGDPVGTRMPLIKGSKSLSSLIHFPASVLFNRKTSGFKYLVLEGAVYGVTMGSTGGKKHQPEILSSRFRKQGKAGVLIRQVGTTMSDPRFFDCWFSEEPYGIKAEASGGGAVLRPDVDECRFWANTIAGIHLTDQSHGAADVGGFVQNSWFEGGGDGVHVESGKNAANTRIAFRGNSFHQQKGDGLEIVVNMPYDPKVTIEDCSFSSCGRGIRITGTFPPGVYSFTLKRNVVMNSLKVGAGGFDTSMVRTGTGTVSIRFLSENNLAIGNGTYGFLYSFGSDLQLSFDSFGDRALENGFRGTKFSCSSKNASIRFRGGILANNRRMGMSLNAVSRAKVQFMTFADNGAYGFYSISNTLYQIDHCIFANNSFFDASVPSSQAISYSLFQGSSRVGKGNLKAVPKLARPSYHLLPGSPCIDAGDSAALAPSMDFEGDPRVLAGKGNKKIPDIGADEFSPTGSAHGFGIDGFGNLGFRPRIGVTGSPRDVRIGRSFGITLLNAKDLSNSKAGVAALMLGSGETGPFGHFDLGFVGAPGNFLWTNPLFIAPPVRPDGNGSAKVNFLVPNSLGIVGVNLSAQWWVLKPKTNRGGFVTTGGLRVQIGK